MKLNLLLKRSNDLFRLLLGICLMLLVSFSAEAQERKVSGTVLDETGEPVVGATVLVKEKETYGAITGIDGSYTLSIPSDGQTLIITSIGYASTEVSIGSRSVIDVTLAEDVTELGEVVVTALGVERETKALGYSVQEVQGDDITEARETNMVSSLSGKVAGVQVTNSGTTIGGSSRVTIRGESSLNINANQPLFVVDGIPVSNQVVGSSGSGNLEVDYGNAAGEINP
ncbi:MAG: SusC/RagA family protein, partial [Flammeovirgaceae bacterium]|nr:SusC/RagA family protein [Flammeovirgaceae bacterium]